MLCKYIPWIKRNNHYRIDVFLSDISTNTTKNIGGMETDNEQDIDNFDCSPGGKYVSFTFKNILYIVPTDV